MSILEYSLENERLEDAWKIIKISKLPAESLQMLRGILQAAKDLDRNELFVVKELAEALKYGKQKEPMLSRDEAVCDVRKSIDSLNLLSNE